jgi:nucleotide-binding universal stress UspA family protein
MNGSSTSGDGLSGVVVGVDGSAGSAAALRWALREARLRQIELTAVMAWTYLDQHHPGGGHDFAPSYDEVEAVAALDAAVDAALGPDASDVSRRAVCDITARALIDASATADLLVIGSRGLGGFKGLLLGSTSQQCLHHASCPVAVVRPDGADPSGAPNRIVVGVDGSPSSRDALRWAAEEARLRQAELVAVHAWHMPYGFDAPRLEQAAEATVDQALRDAEVPPDVPVIRRLVHEPPAKAILDAAADADLVVIGARGLGGLAGMLLGSIGHQLIHHATRPVVVTRHVVPDQRS